MLSTDLSVKDTEPTLIFLLVASVDTMERQKKTTICMYSTACFSTTYHQHALSTEAQDKRMCHATLREGETACSVLGLSRSSDKRVPSPPLWLQTNVSSSAPGVTYINPALTAPYLDAEQRIRHHNPSLQTAEHVEDWLLFATASLQQQPSNASMKSTVRSVMSREAAFQGPVQAPLYCFCLGTEKRWQTGRHSPSSH